MSTMSYCRFQVLAADLYEAVEAMKAKDIESLSREELHAFVRCGGYADALFDENTRDAVMAALNKKEG